MRTIPTLFLLAAVGVIGGSDQPLSAADSLSAILDKAIAAHGGAEVLAKHKGKAIYSKARGTIEDQRQGPEKIPFVEEMFLQPPNKFKKITNMQIKGRETTFMMVSDGEKHWLKFGEEVREANASEQAGYKEAQNHGDVLDFVKLKGRMRDLTLLPEIEVNGRTAVGAQVTTEGHRDMQLFFDGQSGLLVKTVTWKTYPMTGKTFVEEKVMDDYQDTDGYKWPKRVVAYRDGKRFLTKEVLEFKLPQQIEDRVFAKP